VLFGLAWVGAMILWWRARGGATGAPPAATPARASKSPPARAGLGDLAAAFASNDPKRARQALIAWGHGQWPGASMHDLDALAQRLGPDARQVLMQIDASLFGREETAWDGLADWQRLRPLLARSGVGQADSQAAQVLPPLYPGGGTAAS
jgi:hypothetical protein